MHWDPQRHEPLGGADWDEARARAGIQAVVDAAEAAFDPQRLWPLHPADYEPGTPDVLHGLFLGAAGMVHGLTRLAVTGLCEVRLDLAGIVAGLDPAVGDEDGAGASLLVGASGVLLLQRRYDDLAEAIAANAESPANEVLYGAPGTMRAARAAHRQTGDERFADLWRASAHVLLDRQEPDGLWTQHLFGSPRRFVGAAHGFAGNVAALLEAPEWLDDPGAVAARAAATTSALAVLDGAVATWPTVVGGDDAPRVQWCHGAPGMVISLAGVAGTELLVRGGELTWRAGPLRNLGLCHGTGGNGFAFLKLFELTGDERWRDRARAFAAHGLDQVRGDRFSLSTGDLGVALLAAACLTGDPRFPGLEDL